VPLSPVWRRAPGRAWRRGGSGPLVLLALLAATTSIASAPLFVQLSGDDALSTVREALPSTARTSDSDSVRIVSGTVPTDKDQRISVERLRAIPGMSEPTTLAFSVIPEIQYSSFVKPVVRFEGVEARARIAAVEDPRTALVITGEAPSTGKGVWLPDPVAEQLGVKPGDTVEIVVLTRDAQHKPPKGAKPDPVQRIAVDGTFAVGADGRRPADPAGTAVWSRRVGGIPSDTEFLTKASFLVVGDVPTIERVADRTKDMLMWTTESTMLPGLSLQDAERTAAGVAELREDVKGPSDEPPGPLRTGLISGIETVVATAVSLREATRERADLLAAAGAATGLLAVVVVALLIGSDRKVELRHGAAIGLGPVRTAFLWMLEALLPAVLAVVGGVLLARGTLVLFGPEGTVLPGAMDAAVRSAAVIGALGLLLLGVVAALAWAVSSRGDDAITTPLRAAGTLWLVAHHTPVTTPLGTVTLLPLLLTAVPLVLLLFAGRWAGRVTALRGWGDVALLVVTGTATYAFAGFLISQVSGIADATASAAAAVVCTALVAAVGLTAGVLLGAGMLAPLVDRMPLLVRRGAVAAAASGSMLVVFAGVVSVAAIAAQWPTVTGLTRQVAASATDAAGLLLLSLAYLPNLIVWALAYLAGPGFAVGGDVGVDPFSSSGALLPGIPLLGAIPQEAAPAAPLLLLLPVAAGMVGSLIVRRRGSLDLVDEAMVLLGAAAAVGLASGLLAWLSGGALGSGRLADVGPHGLAVGLAVTALVAAGSLLWSLAAYARPRLWVR